MAKVGKHIGAVLWPTELGIPCSTLCMDRYMMVYNTELPFKNLKILKFQDIYNFYILKFMCLIKEGFIFYIFEGES
mgnify:CR=1 FL=1